MNHVLPIFFSPTGTSRTVVQAIARGTGRSVAAEADLTRGTPSPARFNADELAIVGMPVYRGRIPQTAAKRFQPLEGDGTPAVAVVIYGNRAYEDALLELADLCVAQGFRLVGAAAFVGQHSFCSEETPIAKGRPDTDDLQKAEGFGREIAKRLGQPGLDMPVLPGNRPYREVPPEPFVAATGVDAATCTGCGTCAAVCPTRCIEMADGLPRTAPNACLWCMACVRQCPVGARKIVLPKIHEAAQRLAANCGVRQEPKLLLPAIGNRAG